MAFSYADYTVEERSRLSQEIKKKYPGYLPILIDIPGRVIEYRKYLVPEDAPLSHLLLSIRRKNKITASLGLFVLANNYLLSPSSKIREIYARHAHEDGFLYLTITFENTFG